jgi:maltooligosyltrehalose trehalohydrolase
LTLQQESPFRLHFGARPLAAAGVHFRVWAPLAKEIALVIKAPRELVLPMEREHDCFKAIATELRAGADYLYRIDGKSERPDPVSRWQPHGVHGPSRVFDPDAFEWSDSGWKGIPLDEYVIYELHIGTFTPAGTFAAAVARLDYLREVGITAVEIMPVAQFSGARNWGYDGVYPYAVQSSYGGPDELKRLVDECHRRGLAVIMDVVYNHLGPEGNYLLEFMPCFSRTHKSPWGEALNYDGPYSYGVRRYVIENALYWLAEYHVDALRLDAVHGIFDFGARHVLAELSERFHREVARLGRSAFLIAESDLDDVRVIRSIAEGGWGMDAQWNDAFHHALHTVLTGDRHGYFADYGSLADLRKAIVEGYVYDWRYSEVRKRYHGSSSADRPGRQFVVFTQNHDQIANARAGKRPASTLSAGQEKIAAALLVCAPNLPLFFMGQEFGSTSPFTYFTDFQDRGLARAVSEGRKREYPGFLAAGFIDPQSPAAFEGSKLRWEQVAEPAHEEMLRFHRELLALRKRHRCLSNCRKDLTSVEFDGSARWMTVVRHDPSGGYAVIVCNLAGRRLAIPLARGGLELALFGGESGAQVPVQNIAPDHSGVELEGYSVAIYVAKA